MLGRRRRRPTLNQHRVNASGLLSMYSADPPPPTDLITSNGWNYIVTSSPIVVIGPERIVDCSEIFPG